MRIAIGTGGRTDVTSWMIGRFRSDGHEVAVGLRLTTQEVAAELLDAFFQTRADPGEASKVAKVEPTR